MSNERMDEQMKNKENGITLIALIITIIVMLILIGVTINVALNGGLFDKAKTASDQTNLAKEKEILQTKALGYLNNDGYVDLAEYVSKESPLEGYTLTNNTTYVTASKGTNTFYITKQGGITEEEPQAAPAVTGWTLKANPSNVLENYDGSKRDEFILENSSSELLEIEIKNENGEYYIWLGHFDSEWDLLEGYVFALNKMTSLDDEPLNTTGGIWNKIVIKDNNEYEVNEEFNQTKYPIFEGYLTEDKDETKSGLTLEAVNDYFGEIFVLAQ